LIFATDPPTELKFAIDFLTELIFATDPPTELKFAIDFLTELIFATDPPAELKFAIDFLTELNSRLTLVSAIVLFFKIARSLNRAS